jgi:hypothetical protein
MNFANLSSTDFEAVLRAADASSFSKVLAEGDALIWQNFLSEREVTRITKYLSDIGRNSLPNYHRIDRGAPNFHRLNMDDPRAYVRGCFHQFSFFPWNQDVFGLFSRFEQLFQIKNLLSGNDLNRYLIGDNEPIVPRLSFQFYPRGCGFLNSHRDPVGEHQMVVPTVCLSRKGSQFSTGGAYVVDSAGEKIDVDARLSPGDVVFFDATLEHGVDLIDETSEPDWPSFEGRWVLVIATNKIAGSAAVADAVDLGSRT